MSINSVYQLILFPLKEQKILPPSETFHGLNISPKRVCGPAPDFAGTAHSAPETHSWIRGGEGKGKKRRENEGKREEGKRGMEKRRREGREEPPTKVWLQAYEWIKQITEW